MNKGFTKADFLMAEAFEQNSPLLAVKAIQKGFDVNEVSDGDMPILWVAAALGSSLMLKTLLENGANPNWRKADGESVMSYCEMGGNSEIFDLLMQWSFTFAEGEGAAMLRRCIKNEKDALASRLMALGFADEETITF